MTSKPCSCKPGKRGELLKDDGSRVISQRTMTPILCQRYPSCLAPEPEERVSERRSDPSDAKDHRATRVRGGHTPSPQPLADAPAEEGERVERWTIKVCPRCHSDIWDHGYGCRVCECGEAYGGSNPAAKIEVVPAAERDELREAVERFLNTDVRAFPEALDDFRTYFARLSPSEGDE